MKAILGKKIGMTRLFDGDMSVPVTIVDTSACVVSHVSEQGVELGLDKIVKGSQLESKYKKLGYVPKFRKLFADLSREVKEGDVISASIFAEGDMTTICAKSKGKGFQGVVKRWGFKGGPKTHGQSDRLRAPGSIGAGTDPGRVIKGKRMAGRMGGDNITLKDKKIVKIVDNYLMIKGPIPGNNNDLVIVKAE